MAASAITETKAFGVVTVMDVKVYTINKAIEELFKGTRDNADTTLKGYYDQVPTDTGYVAPLCFIDHLQVATLTTEGPSIEIQGGKYNNKLIKYGKTARCEMTDALAQADALVALGGAEWDDTNRTLSVTDKFGAPVCVVGKTFVVDQKSGKHVSAHIILYKFLPDSTPTFAFDSGNAATFDLNGDLLAVEFAKSASTECGDGTGIFFSIVFDSCTLPE